MWENRAKNYFGAEGKDFYERFLAISFAPNYGSRQFFTSMPQPQLVLWSGFVVKIIESCGQPTVEIKSNYNDAFTWEDKKTTTDHGGINKGLEV